MTEERPPRLLVVDDDPAIVELLHDYFTAEGYAVETAADGRAALDAARQMVPDVVFLDLVLPGLDGPTVLAELHALDAGLPVIVMTGRSDPALWGEMAKRGAFECVAKPFNFAQLGALVRLAATRRRHGL